MNRPSRRTYQLAARRQKSTFVHGLLTFLTFGLWSPVWIMAALDNKRAQAAKAKVDMYEASLKEAG